MSERIRLVGATADITVSQDDSGRIICVLVLANFALRQARAKAIHIEFIEIGGGSLSDINPHLEQPVTVIPARGVGELVFTVRLGSGEIRELQRFVHPPSYNNSSPYARTALRGTMTLDNWSGSHEIPFEVSGIVPWLNMYNSSNVGGA